jgi:hypothetical protein
MPWMGPRKAYYYTKTYKNGRAYVEYIGAGPDAELIAAYDQIDQSRREMERYKRRRQLAQLDREIAPPVEMVEHARIVAELERAALTAAGYHQHHRQWRKRRMKQLSDAAPTRAEFIALLNKATAEGSTAAVRRELRRIVTEYPEYGRAFDLANRALDALIDGMPADKAGKAIAGGRADALRNELSGPSPSVLERLLIDQVVLSYLHLNMIEYQHGPLMGGSDASMEIIEFWERRLDGAQRRYLRAIESLARVRRLLKLPGPQFNINMPGGQQLNVGEMKV